MLSCKPIPVVTIKPKNLYEELSEEEQGCSDNTLSFQSERYNRLIEDAKQLQFQAQEQLKRAQRESEELYYQAREEISRWEEEASTRGFEQGFAKGQDEGFEQGFVEGEAQGVAKYQAEIDRLKETWLSVNGQIKQDLEEVGPQLVELMIQAVEKLTFQQFQSNPETLQQCIQEMILSLGKRQRCFIQVEPSNVEKIEAYLPTLKALTPDVRIQVIPNAKLKAEDCLLETEIESIDLTMDAQLETLKEVWLQVVKQ